MLGTTILGPPPYVDLLLYFVLGLPDTCKQSTLQSKEDTPIPHKREEKGEFRFHTPLVKHVIKKKHHVVFPWNFQFKSSRALVFTLLDYTNSEFVPAYSSSRHPFVWCEV